jgi:hypothetical protein
MSNEILYIIIFIICILIIKKACNVCFQNMIYYIIIVLSIIYFVNYISYYFNCGIKEAFLERFQESNLCNIVKDNFNNITNNVKKKCIKDENKESKQEINNGIDCYNFTGNEIVAKNNVSSWCDLNSVDIDIIDKAIKKI